MIELRPFEGTAEELERFIVGVWSTSYRGKMPFPRWTAEYFDWQFGLNQGLPRDHLLVAYEGTRLIGTLLGIPRQFHHLGEVFQGTQGSWLSVDPDFRRQRVGSLLRQRMLEDHRQRGLRGQLGYVFHGSRLSLGNRFWKSKPEQHPQALRNVGFWARVLQPARAAQWNVNPWEAWATRLAAPIVVSPRPAAATTIRPFEVTDLASCLQLMNDQSLRCDFGCLWSASELLRQLSFNVLAKCLVVEQSGVVLALCNYHVLPFQGRTVERVGIIDFTLCRPGNEAVLSPLLKQALVDMQQLEAVLVLKLRSGGPEWWALVRNQFLARLSDSKLCFNVVPGEDMPPTRWKQLHVLWR